MSFDFKINKIESPLSVQFELTYNCNNRCGFCYNVNKSPDSSDVKDEYNKILSFENITGIIDKFCQAKIFKLVLTGGEPTLHPDFFKILNYINGSGLQPSFITNANNVTPEFAHTAFELGVRGVQVSLHGSNRKLHEKVTLVNGSFDKAIDGIKNFIKNNIHVNVNMTVCRTNITDIVNTAKLVKSLGCTSFSISRFVASGDGLTNNDTIGVTKNDLNFMVEEIEKVEHEVGMDIRILTPIPLCSIKKPEVVLGKMARCDGGISWCGVSPTGKVRFCTHSSEIAGDIREGSLEEIWQRGEPFVRCQSMENVPEQCKSCKAFQYCGGGCRSHAYNCTGDYKGVDSCATLENIESLNKRLPAILEELNRYENSIMSYDKTTSLLSQKPFVDRTRVMFRKEGEEILSFNGERLNMFNQDAMNIFELCNGELTVEEIIESLSQKIGQNFDELKPIILDFFESSSQLNIIRWNPIETGSNEPIMC